MRLFRLSEIQESSLYISTISVNLLQLNLIDRWGKHFIVYKFYAFACKYESKSILANNFKIVLIEDGAVFGLIIEPKYIKL